MGFDETWKVLANQRLSGPVHAAVYLNTEQTAQLKKLVDNFVAQGKPASFILHDWRASFDLISTQKRGQEFRFGAYGRGAITDAPERVGRRDGDGWPVFEIFAGTKDALDSFGVFKQKLYDLGGEAYGSRQQALGAGPAKR